MLPRKLGGPTTLVIASIIGLAVGLPQIFLTTFTVFLTPLNNEFGWSRSQASLLFSIITICIAFAAPAVASLINKYGLRPILSGSIVLLTVSIFAMAWSVSGYASFVIWVIVIGVVGTGTTTFTYLGVFPSWFTKRLGIALGIAAAGIGLGQMLFPILAQYLISNFGWRNAYQLIAVISLVVGLPGALFIIRNRNSNDAEEALRSPKNESDDTSGGIAAIKQLARTSPQFWALAAGFFIIPMIAAGCTLHAMPILLEKGIETGRAAGIVALAGFSIMVARVGAGFLLDWIGARTVAILACVAAIAAPLILSSWAPLFAVALAPLLYGMALGIEGDLMPYGIRNAFGAEKVPLLYGSFFGVFNLGVVFGPLLMGISYDLTGRYDTALIALSASAVLAIPLFLLGLRPQQLSIT